jgi:hypothetical protein
MQNIDHDAPKDLGWAAEAILDLDTRLKAVQEAQGAPPPEAQDLREYLASLEERIAALEGPSKTYDPFFKLNAAAGMPAPDGSVTVTLTGTKTEQQ